MKFCKSHGMGNGGHKFMKEIFEELNITEEQKEKLMKLKKGTKKDKMKLAVKYIFGKANMDTMLDMIPEKIAGLEEILNEEQKEKAKKIMMEKHHKFFAHKLFMMKDNIKELVEVAELSEEQKEKAEKILTLAIEHENCQEIFTLKSELKASLSEDQINRVHEYIKSNTHIGEVMKKLNISSEQETRFKELHEKMCSSKAETCQKFKKGEITFSDMAKQKIAMVKEFKNVLTAEQIKQIKSMHKAHCHGHGLHGFKHGHGECC